MSRGWGEFFQVLREKLSDQCMNFIRPGKVRKEGDFYDHPPFAQQEALKEKLENRLTAVTHCLNGMQMKLAKGSRSPVPQRREDELSALIARIQDTFHRNSEAVSVIAQNVSTWVSSKNMSNIRESLPAYTQTCSTQFHELIRMVQNISLGIEEVREAVASLSLSTSSYLSAMEQEGLGFNQMAEGIEETVRIVKDMLVSVEAGRLTVSHNAKGMDKIRLTVTDATEIVRKMGGRSAEIVGMVKVIRDVAERTNLLALNAGIIAAQAGEHGRSFAVVAEEIKALAERTTLSAKEITQMVGRIQKETADAIRAMEVGVKSVEEGVNLTLQVGEALENISSCAKLVRNKVDQLSVSVGIQSAFHYKAQEMMAKIGELVQQIRQSVERQKLGVSEVTRLIQNVQGVVEQTKTHISEEMKLFQEGIDAVKNPIQDLQKVAQELEMDCDLFEKVVTEVESLHSTMQKNISDPEGMEEELRGLSDQVKLLEGLLAEQGMEERR